MSEFTAVVQLVFTFIIGIYFLARLKDDGENERSFKKEYTAEAESLNKMRRVHLNEPMNETARPTSTDDIVGQQDGVRALRAALWGVNPQHVIIYGPPGVGKTAAARIIMDEVKNSPGTPFGKNAPFIEADASIMQCDERGFADPLIGSVHDPIYQGSGSFGQNGIPQPKAGAVTRAHGGVLFLDEIGELPNEQINKLLKVLEDRRVLLESSYYNSANRKIPPYIRDVFENGLPADFRLIGATTVAPEKIPEAIRSRCSEVFFTALSRENIIKIVLDAVARCNVSAEPCVAEIIAEYARNGRDAVKILQSAVNLAKMDNHSVVTAADVNWIVNAGRYKKNSEPKILDISMIKPFGSY